MPTSVNKLWMDATGWPDARVLTAAQATFLDIKQGIYLLSL